MRVPGVFFNPDQSTMAFDLQSLGSSRNEMPPRHLGSRYAKNGTFLTERGNTVVRHVLAGTETRDALLDIRKQLQSSPVADRFTFTAPESLHMTVFQGLIETERSPEVWPSILPLDMPINATTRFFHERLQGFQGPGEFHMRVAEVTPFGLTLEGATVDDEQCARDWRDALIEPFAYRSPNHDSYRFHITMAYIVDWLDDDDIEVFGALLTNLTAHLQSRLPVVELGPPKFCTFEDMNAFPPVLSL